MTAPLIYTWDGEAMVPHPRCQHAADRQFVVGADYRMEEVTDRSRASHDQQFAWIGDAWSNLREEYRFEPWARSPEHLRKYALIRTRFCTTEQFPCSSGAEAERWASRLQSDDEYCLVTVTGTVVNRFRAESQKMRSMGAKRFQESKTAILDFISNLLEVDPETLRQNAGRAA